MKSFREYLTEAIPKFEGDPIEHTLNGQKIATGTPIKVPYVRNISKTKTPNYGSRFGQDIEPHGTYITPLDRLPHVDHDKELATVSKSRDTQEYGEVHFKNPIVIRSDDNDPTVGWKKRLHQHYGKKGRALSKAIIKHGHDGIITVNKYGPSETVNLQSFK